MNLSSPNNCKQLESFLFSTFLEKSNDIIMITDGGDCFNNASILGINSSFELITGLTQKKLLSRSCAEWINVSLNQLRCLNTGFKLRVPVQLELTLKNIKNDLINLQFEIYPIKQGTDFWIWQCKPLEIDQCIRHSEQLIEQNNMRFMEKMAAQSAHDFNNVLAVIMGNNDLILNNIDASSPFYPLLQSISLAIDKGTHLTSTLQLFAQKALLTNVEFEINNFVSLLVCGLREEFGLQCDFQLKLSEQPCRIFVDRKLLGQSITHLVVNAVQSMQNTPIVAIEVSVVFIPKKKDVFEQVIMPQEYVKITISDTGKGINPSNLPLIFTPFFTTQKANAAKGLGLSMVYGFLKQSQGYCLVDTEVGKGSSFSLIFKTTAHSGQL